MAQAKTISAFVIFKSKDQRHNSKVDKTQLFRSVVKRNLQFLEPHAAFAPEAPGNRKACLDFNHFESPILCAELTPEEAESLRAHPDVVAVTQDAAFPFKSQALDGFAAASGQQTPDGVKKVRAPKAWKLGRGKGIKIAILDCGIDPTHPDLAANYRGGVNTYDHLKMILLSHGTHCAGIAAAVDNDLGVIGVAPDAELYSVKVGQATGTVKALIAGIYWCIENRMNIISISREYHDSAEIEKVCKSASAAGILIIASAGNVQGPVPNEATAQLPAPACYPTVLAVSGINDDDTIGAYSARGPKVELCAPGTAVASTILRGRYAKRRGTSMAAPHVAGAAAVVWSIFPKATNRQVREILTQSARQIGKKPGRSPRFGFGCVDVAAAAKLAARMAEGDG